jgi:hypothetical protein
MFKHVRVWFHRSARPRKIQGATAQRKIHGATAAQGLCERRIAIIRQLRIVQDGLLLRQKWRAGDMDMVLIP